jgi:hypothetical protein
MSWQFDVVPDADDAAYRGGTHFQGRKCFDSLSPCA